MHNQEMNQTEQNPVRTIDPGKSTPGSICEVVVHIDSALDEEQFEAFEQELRGVRGILDLSFCRNRHQLMIVQYQPDLVSYGMLIEQVKILAGSAQLIGPI